MLPPFVRFGSKADMCSALGDVRFVPKADSCTAANNLYSITSSATESTPAGTSMPSARAV